MIGTDEIRGHYCRVLDLLEFLLELLVNLADFAHRWRFCLCLVAGGILAEALRHRIDHPKACATAIVLTLVTALCSGLAWEVRSG